ncbi:MAG: glycosyltransferase family 2 protein [Pseudomonadota bacterium]
MRHVAIIVVNYRTAGLVLGCIDSLRKQDLNATCHVYIVDNHSEDGSFEKISQYVEEEGLAWVTVIAAERNGGFAYGNNIALRRVAEGNREADYIWLLNPDTAVRKESCQILVDHLDHGGVHIAGSRLEDEDGTPQVSHFNVPTIGTEFVSSLAIGLIERLSLKLRTRRDTVEQPEMCDWVSGSSMMFTRELFERIGYMDEQYFLYFEELDYCLRAHRVGYPSWHVPDSRVVHYVGGATGISDSRKQSPRRPTYWFDSRRRFFLKNYGAWKLIGADLAFIVGYSLFLLRKKLTGSDLSMQPPHFLRDLVRHSFLRRGFSLEG